MAVTFKVNEIGVREIDNFMMSEIEQISGKLYLSA